MTKEKIIIVDDEPDVLDLCRRVLETRGFQVTTVHDGYKAIEYAQQEHFDLLLTDIRMPGISGLEVAQSVKQVSPDTICVTMTGFSSMDTAIEALKLDIDEFVLKPFTPDELLTSISKALEKERLRKENFRLRSLIPLFELNKTLMGVVEVDSVLRQLLEIAYRETKADFACLYMFSQGQISAHFCQTFDSPPEYYTVSQELAQIVFDNGRQIILNHKTAFASPQYRAWLKQLNAQYAIATPLKSKETSLGALILARTATNFALGDADFLAVLAGQAGIALDNARLFTQIQEAYEELKTLDHVKSEFINIAAHELRTPLAILTGYASMLEEDLQGVNRDYMSVISRNAFRLSSIIDDILRLHSLESGIVTLAQEPVNLLETVQEAIRDMSLWIEQKKLVVNVEISADFPQMIADPQKLNLILINLLDNAVKFTPPGNQIVLQARANGENVIVSLTNTGISVPQKELSRIFNRFYQIEKSLTREHGGIGLGLAVVKGMVGVCGGEIYAESIEGQSTTFTFTLPLDNSHLKDRVLEL
jgi:signal transduction histidine kinase/CheY-like chemotaxis protein